MLPKPPQCLCYKFKANITDTKHQSEHVGWRGKTRASHSRLVFGLPLIGWKSSARFLSQSCGVVMQTTQVETTNLWKHSEDIERFFTYNGRRRQHPLETLHCYPLTSKIWSCWDVWRELLLLNVMRLWNSQWKHELLGMIQQCMSSQRVNTWK